MGPLLDPRREGCRNSEAPAGVSGSGYRGSLFSEFAPQCGANREIAENPNSEVILLNISPSIAEIHMKT